jgi:hypothetical protein
MGQALAALKQERGAAKYRSKTCARFMQLDARTCVVDDEARRTVRVRALVEVAKAEELLALAHDDERSAVIRA